MDITPVTIGKFTVAPFMGALFGQDSLSDDFAKAGGSDFQKQMEVLHLKGQWPPSDEARRHLEEITHTIEYAESKTGIQFARKIAMLGGSAGYFAVRDKALELDFSIASDKSPITNDQIEGLLLHEAAHVKYRDPEHQAAIGQWAGLVQFVAALKDFYHAEPDKFAHIATQEFGSIEAFHKILSSVVDDANRALAPVAKHPEFDSMTDVKMLDMLTRNSAMSDAMLSVKAPDPDAFGNFVQLTIAFHGKSQRERMLFKKSVEVQGIPIEGNDYIKSMLGIGESTAFPKLDEVSKKQLDSIEREILIPAGAQHRQLVNFLGAYSRAGEYRADDVAIINATHPEVYAQGLRKAILHAEQNAQPMPKGMMELQQQAQQGQPEFMSHPPIDSRVDRSERLLKRIHTMREMCGEVDVNAAIAAVNAEMLSIAPSKQASQSR